MAQEVSEELLNIQALERFLRERLPDAQEPLQVSKHEAGYSNETFYVTCGPYRWVLRRPPRGELLPTSHDVLREWRVISALYGAGVRVPKPIVACEDASVVGVPFYMMERVEGVVVRDTIPLALDTPGQRRGMAEELMDSLVEIHAVDYKTAGLEGLGKPEGYLERQVRRWAGQLELTRVHTRALPGIDEVTEWLRVHLPESGPSTVVHGDYKLDNVMYGQEAPARLLAVLDWEMATLGDPLADVGYCLSFWGPAGTEREGGLHDLNRLTQAEGFPSREEMAALYEEKSGRSVHNLPFYLCLAMWKLAIIREGLYALHLQGRAPNPRTGAMGQAVLVLIERMHSVIAEA
jgi:aminoglycoside phosphotransferase (APT) family kinase protein